MAVRNNRPRPSGGSDLYEDLTSAAMWGRLGLLESLLDNGADPNFPNGMGNTALHEAAYYGERECVSVLLHHKGLQLLIGREGGGGEAGMCVFVFLADLCVMECAESVSVCHLLECTSFSCACLLRYTCVSV